MLYAAGGPGFALLAEFCNPEFAILLKRGLGSCAANGGSAHKKAPVLWIEFVCLFHRIRGKEHALKVELRAGEVPRPGRRIRKGGGIGRAAETKRADSVWPGIEHVVKFAKVGAGGFGGDIKNVTAPVVRAGIAQTVK